MGELTVGIVPFFSSSNTEMYKKIIESPLLMASWIAVDCQDLIKALLQKKVENRLGFIDDVDAIKQHKWFKQINWKKVLKKEIEPPYKPEIENKDDLVDTTCVADKFKEQSIRETIVTQKPKESEQGRFRGFTFRGSVHGLIDNDALFQTTSPSYSHFKDHSLQINAYQSANGGLIEQDEDEEDVENEDD